jgi:DNA-binding beta-propeller fold protein YncE
LRIVVNASTKMMPSVQSITTIGNGFSERTDPAALVIGPTGLALSKNNKILYIADSLNNRIAWIPDPLTRTTSIRNGLTLTSGGHLNDPLGMALSVEGHILTTNGNDGFMVETSPKGVQLSATLLDASGSPPGAGALFGLIDVPGLGVVYVDDATNTLNLFH